MRIKYGQINIQQVIVVANYQVSIQIIFIIIQHESLLLNSYELVNPSQVIVHLVTGKLCECLHHHSLLEHL